MDPSSGARKPAHGQDDFQTYCRNIRKHFIILQLDITEAPDALSICQTLSFTPEEKDGFTTREECKWMIGSQPEAGCRKPLNASLGAAAIQDCLAYGVYHADCSLIDEAPLISEETRAMFRAKCRDAAAYRRAFRGKNAEFCADSLVCRMLMGENICGRHLDKLAAPSSNLQTIDALLARAKNIGTLPAREQEELRRVCLAEFPQERILDAPMDFPLDDGMSDDLRQYHECEAFSQVDAGICDRLSRYLTSRQKDLAPRCRAAFIRSNIIKLNASRGPDSAEACLSLPFSEDDLYQTNLEKECAWMTNPAIQPQCRDPISPNLEVYRIKDCLAHHVYHANETRCPLIEQAPLPEDVRAVYRSRCQDALAYRKAYQAKNPGLCRDSLVCRMLMGEKVCGRHLDRFRGKFCGFRAQKKLLKRLLVRLDALLERYEPKSNPAYAARRRAYEALRKSFEQRFSP